MWAGLGMGAARATTSVTYVPHGVAPARVLSDAGERLILPAGDADRRLASIVAVDIDADGDRDVVGLDWSSGLIVWLNDGSGHLTRQPAQPAGPILVAGVTVLSHSDAATRTSDQDDRVPATLAPASRPARLAVRRASDDYTAPLASAPVRHVLSRGPPALLA
jgi:hypothetical protein